MGGAAPEKQGGTVTENSIMAQSREGEGEIRGIIRQSAARENAQN